MEKPHYIKPNGAAIPDALKVIPRWVLWKAFFKEDKWTKVPMQTDGKFAKSTDPATWANFDEAWNCYRNAAGNFDGLGLVLNGDGLVGLDIDHAIDGRSINQQAKTIMESVNSYTELSPSGTGLRIFCKGKLPESGRKKGIFEFYESGRYLTITGHSWNDPLPIVDRAEELKTAHASIFGNNGDKEKETKQRPATPGDVQDRLERAFKSKTGPEIQRLWNGDTGGDHSADDLALCSHLAFWLDGDTTLIDAAFRSSGLMREKWDKKHFSDGRTYGQATIEKAVAGCSAFYGDRVKATARPEDKTAPEANVEPTMENLTDLGNAKRLVRLHGNDLRFVPQWNAWYLWDDSRFKKDEALSIDRLAETVVQDILRESSLTADKDRRATLAKGALAAEANQKRLAMIQMARSRVAIEVQELDVNKWLLTTRNKTIDLKTGAVFSPRRTDNITKRADVNYDPGANCPNWLDFLSMVTAGNVGIISFLQKAAGYSLTGVCDERCIFILWGSGRNGKSTFVETLASILDDYSSRTPTETLLAKKHDGIPNDIAALKGARFVHAAEAKEGKQLSESLIKDLTGNDTISARFMRAEWFSFRPEFKLWLSTNHKPVITGTEAAIWDRIRLIPFTVRIPDDKLKPMSAVEEMFKKERPGILNWMLEGLEKWKAEGLVMSEEVRKATTDYRAEMDNLEDFFTERCVIDRVGRISSGELFTAYRQWAAETKEPEISKKSFGMRMIERGFEPGRGLKGERIWLGIGLLSQ